MITKIIIAVIVGLCFDRAQMQISGPNYGSLYNGYGAIELTAKKAIKAPMAYRVLVPFLVTWIVKAFKIIPKYHVFVYQAIKAFFVVVAAFSVVQVFGYTAMFLTFSILLLTIQYDYWDWPIELAAVVFAAGGLYLPTIILAILFSMSRETSIVIGPIFYASTGNLSFSMGLLVLTISTILAVRLIVGKQELYCKRYMWNYNIGLFKNFFKWKPFLYSPLFVSAAITIGTVLTILIKPQFWFISILLVAGWILAKADEPRIFSSCVPFIAVLIGGVIV